MNRKVVLAFVIIACAGLAFCAPPPLVWGSDEKVEARLLKIVPPGSPVDALENEAADRGWRVRPDERHFKAGTLSYFNRHGEGDCRYAGGPSRIVIVAEYSTPFTTTVETQWHYDQQRKLRDICIRRTTDAL